MRFGRLTVILLTSFRRKSRCICICDCGESKMVRSEVLVRGDTKSCGCIQRDNGSWNRGLKGIHLSPASEFKKGKAAHNKLPVGSETITKDKGRGQPRVYRKVAEPNIWRLRAVLVWEEIHGPVPNGYVIHHVDHDSLNDSPTNLECLTRAEHARVHCETLLTWRRLTPTDIRT